MCWCQYFFRKNSTFTLKALAWELCYRFLNSVLGFLRQKASIDGNKSITDHASEIWLLDFSGLATYRKTYNDVAICRLDIIVKTFWHWRVSLVTFSYWSKFHVSIIAGSGLNTIFLCKGLIRNLETGSIPSELCPMSGGRGELWISILAQISLIKSY